MNAPRKRGLLAVALLAAALSSMDELGFFSSKWSASAAERQPLYYQDPTGKPDYSPTPKKDAVGRDYVPVYEDTNAAPATARTPPPPLGGERRILYYRNPMGLPDTSPVPKKDSMGMDYIPVYA